MSTHSRIVAIARFNEGLSLLKSIAERENVDIKSIIGPYRYAYLVVVRKEFCRRAKDELGLGCVTIGKLLNLDHTTVLYHQTPLMQARKATNRPKYYGAERLLRLKPCQNHDNILT